VAKGVEHLLYKHEAPSSNSRPTKKKGSRAGRVAHVVECPPSKHEVEFKTEYCQENEFKLQKEGNKDL
jgi:hypothetical protein